MQGQLCSSQCARSSTIAEAPQEVLASRKRLVTCCPAGVLRAGSMPRAALAAEVQTSLGSALGVAASQVTLTAVTALPAAAPAGRRLTSAAVAGAPPHGPLLPNVFNVTAQLVPPYAAMPYPRLQVCTCCPPPRSWPLCSLCSVCIRGGTFLHPAPFKNHCARSAH
jgi:hypothetical protein